MKQASSFPPSQDEVHPSEHPSRAQQWAGIIIVSIATPLAIVGPPLTVWLTGNMWYAGGVSVGSVSILLCIWGPLGRFLYKRKEDYALDALKIQYGDRRPSSPQPLPQTPKPWVKLLQSKNRRGHARWLSCKKKTHLEK